MGTSPKVANEELLEKLARHAMKVGEFGIPEEEEYGWSGGRHIFDGQFTFEHNIFNDALHFALRIDTNKVPGDLKKAYAIMEEEAVAKKNPSGFISKSQKSEVKEAVRGKVEDDLRSGKFRRSKLVPILWDVPSGVVYCAATGASLEKLLEIFERTFELQLAPMSSGSIGLRTLEDKHNRREYEDLRPTRFVIGPDGDSAHPDYPWVAKGPEPKDFLGNEFMLWLWYEADARTSVIKTEAGDVTIFIDRSLDIDCAYGQTGKDGIRGAGPSRMPESRDALRVGKLPRKAGLVLDCSGQAYNLALSAESLAVGGLKLPDIEDADSPRTLFEERVSMLRDFTKMLDAMYELFLKVRVGGSWESQVSTIRKWVMQISKQPVAAVA